MATTKIKEAIQSSLSESICMELGIMPLAIDGEVIEIGAMNPSFPKLIEYIDEIKDLHEIEAKIVFVDATIWEKWYDQDEQSRFSHLLPSTSELNNISDQSDPIPEQSNNFSQENLDTEPKSEDKFLEYKEMEEQT